MKHTFWFCLCISALLLTGCGKGEASAAETVAGIGSTDSVMEETTEPAYLDTLGEKDFNNAAFSVIGVDYAARRNFPDAETSGEVVNDALTERDNSIMERYHVGIAYTKHENATDVASLVRKEVLANENSWHMAISAISGSLINLMNENVLYDLTELPYLDLSANWWSSPMYEKTQINGHMYITMGDISPQKYYAPYVLAYNKMLAENYHFPDLYEMVLDGKWTLDAFASLTKDMEQDLNGDGKMDETDFWSYSHVNTSITGCAHFVGAGASLAESSENGVSVNLNTEKNAEIVARLQDILVPVKYPDMNITNNIFMEDRALFYGNSLSNIIANFREMKSDFGIIPVPKYDEAQTNYYAYINTWCLGGVAVPLTCSDPELTGFMMEALCYQSYELVRPALCENLLKQKVSRDEASAQILDLILDNTYLDLNGLYNFGTSCTFVGECIVNEKEFVSGLEKLEKKIQADIESISEILP